MVQRAFNFILFVEMLYTDIIFTNVCIGNDYTSLNKKCQGKFYNYYYQRTLHEKKNL